MTVNAALKLRAKRSRATSLSADTVERNPISGNADDVAAVVHEELAQLSEAHRTTVILVDLEGHSHADAAKVLGWPVGTVSGRLVRARAELKKRLERRGISLSVGVLTAGVVLESTVRAAMAVAVGTTAVPVVVNSLAIEVLAMVASAKRKLMATVAAGLVGVAILSTAGVVVFAQQPKAEVSMAKADDKPAEGWNDPNKHPTLFPDLEPGKNFDIDDAIKKLPEVVVLESDPPEKKIQKKILQSNLRQVQIIAKRIQAGAFQGNAPILQLCLANSSMKNAAKQLWSDITPLQQYAEFQVLVSKHFETIFWTRFEAGVDTDTQHLPMIEAERYAAEIELLKLKEKK